MIRRIKKRDGREVAFDSLKIRTAIQKAIESTNGDPKDAVFLTTSVLERAHTKYKDQVPKIGRASCRERV